MIGARRARRLARRIHGRFRDRPGAAHIATETAIAGLVRWLARSRPERVLEIGAGIGTLTFATAELLSRRRGDVAFFTVEADPFCREQLDANLAPVRGRYRLVAAVDEAEAGAGFDFLIVDGGSQQDPSPFLRLRRGATVFIEGDRQRQAATLERALAERSFACADVRTLRRRTLADGNRAWDGGFRLYRLEPSPLARLRLAAIDLRTKLVYRLRRFWPRR